MLDCIQLTIKLGEEIIEEYFDSKTQSMKCTPPKSVG